jgi:hypothetical protein
MRYIELDGSPFNADGGSNLDADLQASPESDQSLRVAVASMDLPDAVSLEKLSVFKAECGAFVARFHKNKTPRKAGFYK